MSDAFYIPIEMIRRPIVDVGKGGSARLPLKMIGYMITFCRHKNAYLRRFAFQAALLALSFSVLPSLSLRYRGLFLGAACCNAEGVRSAPANESKTPFQLPVPTYRCCLTPQ